MFRKLRLSILKRKAAKLYKRSTPNDLSCGRSLAEYIRPDILISRIRFSEAYRRIKLIDPDSPPDPFMAQEQIDNRTRPVKHGKEY